MIVRNYYPNNISKKKKAAANWMIKTMTTDGCLIATVDDFKKGKLEILI